MHMNEKCRSAAMRAHKSQYNNVPCPRFHWLPSSLFSSDYKTKDSVAQSDKAPAHTHTHTHTRQTMSKAWKLVFVFWKRFYSSEYEFIVVDVLCSLLYNSDYLLTALWLMLAAANAERMRFKGPESSTQVLFLKKSLFHPRNNSCIVGAFTNHIHKQPDPATAPTVPFLLGIPQ